MPFSLNFRYRWHDMPLIQPYLTHLRSLLPSWRARRAVDSHLASPSLDRHHLLISRALRQNFCAVTHSFFLTPLNGSSTSSRPDTKGLLSSVPAKQRKKRGVKARRKVNREGTARDPSPQAKRFLRWRPPYRLTPCLHCSLRCVSFCRFVRSSAGILDQSKGKRNPNANPKSCAPLPVSPVTRGAPVTHTFHIHHYYYWRSIHSSSERLL